MKRILIIIASIMLILLVIVVFIVNKTTKQKTNNIRIYKNTMNYLIQASPYSPYDYEEIVLDEKEKNEIAEYYLKINKRSNDIQEAYLGVLMIKSNDGSGFLYDNGKFALYYDDIDNRIGGRSVRLNERFINFLSNYL